ncbi:39S ribosomal protein L47, mitochondrial [Lamellibrachia satsuma]|nr:39S ribosomal protein L47, mitochondrial [Lamellibrachia satsuma]
MEFFDDKENWGESSVKVGRPWKLDELRLKSNTDLHKLWYVLLKERNVIMTMEAEYKRQSELFPSPERLEKVEESMENLLDVVAERDRAYHLLETGETGEPGERVAINQLGLYYTRRCQEHYVPLEYSRKFKKYTRFNGPWQDRYKQLLREKLLLKERYIYRCRRIVEERRKKVFPGVQLE